MQGARSGPPSAHAGQPTRTLQRTLLIVLSIAYFGNAVTGANLLGVATTIAGTVLCGAAAARRTQPALRGWRRYNHYVRREQDGPVARKG